MTLDELIDGLPPFAKDLKLNYSSLVRNSTELTASQLWGTVVASAVATRSALLTAAAFEAAAGQITAQELEAAKTAAAIMGMNNIFYRFQHLVTNPKYSTMGARLRMNGLRGHGAAEVDFELWALAVSAINGCGKCVDASSRVIGSQTNSSTTTTRGRRRRRTSSGRRWKRRRRQCWAPVSSTRLRRWRICMTR